MSIFPDTETNRQLVENFIQLLGFTSCNLLDTNLNLYKRTSSKECPQTNKRESSFFYKKSHTKVS